MRNLTWKLALTIISTFTLTGIVYSQNKPDRWEEIITQFETMDKEQSPPLDAILFVGSSSIRAWKTLEEDMAPLTVINRGFGGSQFEDAIRYIDRIVVPYKPSMIVVYEGDNDIANDKSPERVFDDYKKFVSAVRESFSEVPIFFMSIKPSPLRWSMWDNMKKANELIKDYTAQNKKLEYLDVSSIMLDKEGNVRSELFLEDNLHMNAKGYALWTSFIKPRLIFYRSRNQ
ncbi:MAG: hypothetical protein JXB48_05670 [Candidatus Latescibacteria bacterium]|nr:hypothetical protein [Candidatus Latescibacterota bacterium]